MNSHQFYRWAEEIRRFNLYLNTDCLTNSDLPHIHFTVRCGYYCPFLHLWGNSFYQLASFFALHFACLTFCSIASSKLPLVHQFYSFQYCVFDLFFSHLC